MRAKCYYIYKKSAIESEVQHVKRSAGFESRGHQMQFMIFKSLLV